MTGEDLLSLVIDTDLNPGLAAEVPAAVHAARVGYTRPLLRLFYLDEQASISTAEDLSLGLNAATTCADGEFPWSPGTPPADRKALLDAAVAALPPGALGPFGSWAARMGTAFYCELWPAPAGGTSLGPGPLPNVPVLAVSGGLDMRTPTSSAIDVLRHFPQGHLLVVPGVGHSVLGTDLSFCSQRAVRTWILGGAIPTSCPRVPALVNPLGSFPRIHGKESPRGTLLVAAKAVREGEAMWLQAAFAGAPLTPAGLYGGKVVPSATQPEFTLVRYAILPGVRLSGKLRRTGSGFPLAFKGNLSVSGPAAAAGMVRVSRARVSGLLGGRRVSGGF
jgi:hypothetical protein